MCVRVCIARWADASLRYFHQLLNIYVCGAVGCRRATLIKMRKYSRHVLSEWDPCFSVFRLHCCQHRNFNCAETVTIPAK